MEHSCVEIKPKGDVEINITIDSSTKTKVEIFKLIKELKEEYAEEHTLKIEFTL